MHGLLDTKSTNLHAHRIQKYKLGPSSKTKKRTVSLAQYSSKFLYAVRVSQTTPATSTHHHCATPESVIPSLSVPGSHARLLAPLQNYLRELLFNFKADVNHLCILWITTKTRTLFGCPSSHIRWAFNL